MGLVCKLVTKPSLTIETFVSMNVTDVVDHLAVNLVVGWKLLISFKNSLKLTSVNGQTVITSSVHLHHTVGVILALSNIICSNFPIKILVVMVS